MIYVLIDILINLCTDRRIDDRHNTSVSGKPAKNEITISNVAKSRGVIAKRKIGVATIHEYDPKLSEIIIQIPVDVKDSEYTLSAAGATASTTKSIYETNSKLESDV